MVLSPDDATDHESPTDHLRSAREKIASLRRYNRVDLPAEVDQHLDEAVNHLNEAVDHLDYEEE